MIHVLPFIIVFFYIAIFTVIYFGYVVPADDNEIRATPFGQLDQCVRHIVHLDNEGLRPWYYLALKQIKPITGLVLAISGGLFFWNGL